MSEFMLAPLRIRSESRRRGFVPLGCSCGGLLLPAGAGPLAGLGRGSPLEDGARRVDGVERNRVVTRVRGDRDRVGAGGGEHATQPGRVTVLVARLARDGLADRAGEVVRRAQGAL